jgi:hypothetical protein
MNQNFGAKGATPKSLICHLWYFHINSYSGKSFGLSSLTIHLKTCEKKWVTEESAKSARVRRKLPKRPAELNNVT